MEEARALLLRGGDPRLHALQGCVSPARGLVQANQEDWLTSVLGSILALYEVQCSSTRSFKFGAKTFLWEKTKLGLSYQVLNLSEPGGKCELSSD